MSIILVHWMINGIDFLPLHKITEHWNLHRNKNKCLVSHLLFLILDFIMMTCNVFIRLNKSKCHFLFSISSLANLLVIWNIRCNIWGKCLLCTDCIHLILLFSVQIVAKPHKIWWLLHPDFSYCYLHSKS